MSRVRSSDLVFRAGGACVSRFGTIRKRTSPWEDVLPTFSRSSIASYVDRSGKLLIAGAGVPRISWLDLDGDGVRETAVYFGERATQNEFTQSEDLTHANWTATRLTTRTANQETGPDDALSLDELVEDTQNGPHYVYQTKTLTADANYALSAWYVAGARTWAWMQLAESGATTNNVHAYFDLSTGQISASNNGAGGTGTFVGAGVEDFTDLYPGLYRVWLVGSVGNAATSIQAVVGMANADGGYSYTGDGSSSLCAGFAQLEDDTAVVSSYVPTTTAAVPRVADALQYPIGVRPGTAFTVYGKILARDLANQGVWGRVIELGTWSGSPTGSCVTIQYRGTTSNGWYFGAQSDASGSGSATLTTDPPTFDDVFEFRMDVPASGGNITCGVSKNEGTEATGTISNRVWDSTWYGVDNIGLAVAGGGSSPGNVGLIDAKIALGSHTLADMRSAS